ncbi:uncharacterized protein PGTG_06601 [Puccinia graminis f. sp. tritici CRL 75-36-700-3]|uniref:Uncharacterized protein n=1 Tax=Puccinia graminis f. sp. tritici (strain CRL 75-36-700-3 / race SCCL) TaxID=418459 RepID=E3K8T9_PUCGT|nr:uncharacterized protein PGTG_06601 [Puccinia graminis f. sp. tritici CRL 75-36-700-3]EFP80645.2 hypothetical protein PGTG_06601 [Puccinia graminis f. sp. tritici CRL 75-36-700-3]
MTRFLELVSVSGSSSGVRFGTSRAFSPAKNKLWAVNSAGEQTTTTTTTNTPKAQAVKKDKMTITDNHPAQTVLLIGSPRSIKDGTYTELITRFDNQGPSTIIEKQLCDRISDGATSLSQSHFDAIHLVVDANDLSLANSSHSPASFLDLIVRALKPLGQLTWSTQSGLSEIESTLKQSSVMADVQVVSGPNESQLVRATKSASTTSNSVLISLPKKSIKASLWSFTTAQPEMIDDSSLLTEEDLKKPSTMTTEDCNPKKAKKACKNCTCGLRELELAQDNDLPAHLKAPGSELPSQPTDPSKLVVNGSAKTFTSSCGSCYLGDAFRCSSCPYLGMPAFEPGQQVKLTAEMGDDIQI